MGRFAFFRVPLLGLDLLGGQRETTPSLFSPISSIENELFGGWVGRLNFNPATVGESADLGTWHVPD